MITVALFGAAGKMGTRISEKLLQRSEYDLRYVEANPSAEARLRERGLRPTDAATAAKEADAVILAVPDRVIGRVAAQIVPDLRSGAMLICLDPAAPYDGQLPARDDVTYFVTHPCHPPIVSNEIHPTVPHDFFGGIAQQNVVCALLQGPEEDYARGEAICRHMFAPVMNAHRITVDQMVLLEPAMTETVALTCMTVIRQALDEVIARGVPEQAARDFMLGHLNATIGILFDFLDAEVSDGAKLAVERAMSSLFQPNWQHVFDPERVASEVRAITRSTADDNA